jgi:hypothetical protein
VRRKAAFAGSRRAKKVDSLARHAGTFDRLKRSFQRAGAKHEHRMPTDATGGGKARKIRSCKMSVSLKAVLINWSAIVGLWAPAYLTLLEHFGPRSMARSDALQWMLVIVGAIGLGSIFFTAWRETRDSAWRAAHGLARTRPGTAGR